MQLTSSNRREVIEDLLDIRIFSQMSNLLKDEIKTRKDQVKSLDLKKQTLKEKMKMQQDFIDELENRGKANIRTKEVKIQSLLEEENTLMNSNESLTENLQTVQIELEQFTGASDKLRKLGNLKGKISNKVSTITKEHKFFTDNTVCPTCGQGY